MPYKNKRDRVEYMKEWRRTHPEYIKNYNKSEKVRAYKYAYNRTPKMIAYRQEYNKLTSIKFSEARRGRRDKTFGGMGGKCAICGFSDYRALQIDHINGDGKNERHLLNRNDYYEKVLSSFLKGEGRYQLLCCNCNWIKRVDNKEYRKNNKMYGTGN